MNLKKSLIIGVSILTLAPVASATFASGKVYADEIDQGQLDVSQSQIDLSKLDSYVTLDKEKLTYHIDSSAKSELSEKEYSFLTSRVKESNENPEIKLAEDEKMTIDGNTVTITEQSTELEKVNNNTDITMRAASFKEGINKVEKYWWGYRVWLSKTAIRTGGAGLTLGSFFIPEKTLSGLVGAIGYISANIPGGIVFNTSPQFAALAPNVLKGALNFWGVSFQ